MMILYMTVNFLLLAGGLWYFGRKTVRGIFEKRRSEINLSLDEAEACLRPLPPPEEAPADPGEDPELAALGMKLERERKLSEAKAEELRAGLENELDVMRSGMIMSARDEILRRFADEAARVMSSEPFASRFRQKESEIADRILSRMKVTAGDRVYILHHDVLYVTLRSAFGLDEELVERIRSAAEEMVKKAGGEISFRVLTDPELTGGLLLRVGDKVFDGTIRNVLLHPLKNELNALSAELLENGGDVSACLEKAIERVSTDIDEYQLGRAISVSDGICWMDGLADSMFGELVEFENGELGMIMDIEPSRVGCMVFGSCKHIQEYSRVRRLGWMADVPVGEELLGRVVDPLGKPLDGRGAVLARQTMPLENTAPAILDRQSVSTPLYTGIKVVDALIPIGKGQRELIIGDRQTGKTAMAVDAIINQRGRDVICIYVAIGQKETSVAGVVNTLKKYGAMEYTTVVCANAFQSAAMLYIAPYAGTAMGEYFMKKGRDVLIVYDDLSKHAVAYRELSLLLHRPSGREAYPGDVFYLHSRLLERSARLSDAAGGGSMTALPIIETQAGDISAYIPTNAISITDGQIFLETDLFNEGQRPAVNVGLSVSRVGGSAQTKAMRGAAGSLRMKLAQYRELASFSRFGSDIDAGTRAALALGERMTAVLKQGQYSPMPAEKQILVFFAASNGFADGVPTADIPDWEERLCRYFDAVRPELLERLAAGDRLTDELTEELKGALRKFTEAGK